MVGGWYRVIIVSALSLSLRDKEREKREIELDNSMQYVANNANVTIAI